MEYCEDQNGTIICTCSLQGHNRGVAVSPALFSFVLFETDTVELEGTPVPHGPLSQLQINPGEWSVGRTIESYEARDKLVSSRLRIRKSRHGDRR